MGSPSDIEAGVRHKNFYEVEDVKMLEGIEEICKMHV